MHASLDAAHSAALGLASPNEVLAAHLGIDDDLCPFCGEEPELELFEVWSPRDFQLTTCCEGLHTLVCDELAQETREGAALLNALGISSLGLGKARRVVDDGCGRLVMDWHLELCDVTLKEAKEFIRLHHEHCPPPVGWKFGAGIRNGRELIGVVTVGRPVARAYDARKTIVEVNRLCVRRDLPSGLVWNACSMAYAFAAREARRRGYFQIVTYTMRSEQATTLKAAGWEFDGETRGGSHSCPSRPREDKTSTEKKLRWKKVLRKPRESAHTVPPVGPLLRPPQEITALHACSV